MREETGEKVDWGPRRHESLCSEASCGGRNSPGRKCEIMNVENTATEYSRPSFIKRGVGTQQENTKPGLLTAQDTMGERERIKGEGVIVSGKRIGTGERTGGKGGKRSGFEWRLKGRGRKAGVE